MGKRALAAAAAVLTLGGGGWRVVASAADEGRNGGRIVRHLPERPPSIPEGGLGPLGQGLVQVPQAVRYWTDQLSSDDAKTVIEDACKLSDLSEVVITDADIERWAWSHGYLYGEDKYTALVGLAKEARSSAGVQAFCDAVG